MRDLVYVTDPHLGITRPGNTTRKSAERYRETVFKHALKQVTSLEGVCTVCGGDLFDSYSNGEHTLWQGMQVLGNLSYCLAGNHDVRNRESAFSSLMFAHATLHSITGKSPVVFQPMVVSEPDLPVDLLMVPHFWSQEDFVKALESLVAKYAVHGKKRPAVLFLHCNYDMPEHWTGNDTTLNLTRDMAGWILQAGIDYIVIGHEHTYKMDFGGRLILPGSLFPTAFDNMDDKFLLRWADGGFSKERVWEAEAHYQKLSPEEIYGELRPGLQFLHVAGELPRDGVLEFMKGVEELWESKDDLLAVKLDVTTSEGTFSSEIRSDAVSISSLRQVIERDLSSQPAMLEMWNTIVGGIDNAS